MYTLFQVPSPPHLTHPCVCASVCISLPSSLFFLPTVRQAANPLPPAHAMMYLILASGTKQQAKWPWAGVSGTMDQNKPFLLLFQSQTSGLAMQRWPARPCSRSKRPSPSLLMVFVISLIITQKSFSHSGSHSSQLITPEQSCRNTSDSCLIRAKRQGVWLKKS